MSETPVDMKKIWLRNATAKDFAQIEIKDWVEGVGVISTRKERNFIRCFGKMFINRDRLRIGITLKTDFDGRENDISNKVGYLYFSRREKERAEAKAATMNIKDEELNQLIGLGSHTAKLAERRD